MKNILIAGGSGLIGQRISQILQAEGYTVAWLSRSSKIEQISEPIRFQWNVDTMTIDQKAIEFADAIINLSGVSIADHLRTKAGRDGILNSRVQSIRLLHRGLADLDKKPEVFINASAIGWYGNRGDDLLHENEYASSEFLGHCCRLWEEALEPTETLGIRTVRIRIGLVLSNAGGALPQIAKPISKGFGAVPGSGKQWQSWIHLEDIAQLFVHSLKNEQMQGVYNGTSPHPVSAKELHHQIANRLHKTIRLPNVPGFILKTALGELSHLLLDSCRCSADKVESTGFTYKFPKLEEAVASIYP